MPGVMEFGVKATGTAAAQSQLKGLSASFVGLQLAVNLAGKALQTAQKWVSDSIESYRSFEKKIREISTILETDNKDAIYGIQTSIETLSKTYGKSADDMAEGMYEILSAAFSAQEGINLLNTATKAAIAGLSSVAVSVDIFTTILNTYGMKVEQANYLSDQLFETVIRGKLRFEDLASSLGYVLPIAANAGIAFEEIAAALSTVTRMGIHVDIASRGLSLGIQNLINPTKEAAEAAQEYSVDMSAVFLQVKGLEGVLEQLNKAMEEHGSIILPNMIKNMRSLRVFMALAGDEGIAGFTEDLGLLRSSAGLTENALASMMLASQTQADILTQHMEYLNRSIGEAWSGFDLWWKKSQIWWGTLLSGGDANKAISDIDEQINNMTLSSLNLLSAQIKLSSGGTTWQKMLSGGITNLDLDTQAISDYFKKTDEFNKLSLKTAGLKNVGSYFNAIHLNTYGDSLAATSETGKKFFEILKKYGVTVEELNSTFSDGRKVIYEQYGQSFIITSNVMKAMEKTIVSTGASAEDLRLELNALEPTVNDYKAAFATASQEINDHKANLLSLTQAITNLKINVKDAYSTLGSELGLTDRKYVFTGKLEYEIAVAKEEMQLSRSQQFTNMAMKYGEEYINQYNESMRDSITTIYNYEAAQKRLSKTLDAQNRIMNYNNIKILELQIRGMERRRGLLRTEEKEIKKYELSNARARLTNMKTQYANENSSANDAYDTAKNNIDSYFDFQEHYLFLLKDARQSDIDNMREQYDWQKYLLGEYETFYTDEYNNMIDDNNRLIELIRDIAPEYVAYFETMWGKTRLEQLNSINLALEKTIDLLEKSGMPKLEYTPTPVNSPTYVNPSTGGYIPIRSKEIKFKNYQHGTNYVPRTGLYNLHQGEKVIPKDKSGATSVLVKQDPITINVNVSGDSNIEKLGERVGRLISSGILKGIYADELTTANTGSPAYFTGRKKLVPIENEFRVG